MLLCGGQAKQEAEREARIEREQSEMGPSDRAIEEENLKKLLEPLGLALFDIPADGHCLYR